MKKFLTIGFTLSGLLLIAWPFDVFATLHGISPHIQLANGHVFHEEPTDFSFLAFLLYPGVWALSLVIARRAIKAPVRKRTRRGQIKECPVTIARIGKSGSSNPNQIQTVMLPHRERVDPDRVHQLIDIK